MKQRHIAALAPLAALALMGFGCNPFASLQQKIENKIGEGIAEKAIEAASGGKVKVDASSGGVKFQDNKTGESISVGTDVAIPSDFPSDIPRYQGSHASIVSLSPDKKSAALVVTLESANVKEVSTWYEAQLTSKGYTKDTSLSATGSLFQAFVKGDDKIVMSIIADPEKINQPMQIQISFEAGGAAN